MALPAFLHPFTDPAAERFLTIVGGEGAAVFDRDGRRYVDALAGLWYCNVGHGRREIADAVHRQMLDLAGFPAYAPFTNERADEVCEVLATLAPMRDVRVFLTSSGAEAVDTAIKLARVAHSRRGERQRTVVVARRHAYHGSTYGGLSAQGIPDNQEGFGPMVGDVALVSHDDLSEVEDLLARQGERVAAVLAEPVIGAGGVFPPVPGYLQGLRRLCDQAGAFLVLDEVICGFGRLGHWWGASRYGVRPDLVTFAKGVTSGYLPLGGVLVGPAVRAPLEVGDGFILRHGHTASGHPAACAAALANLAILEEECLGDRAEPIGKHLSDGLGELVDEGLLVGVRGEAAMLAAVLPDGVAPAAVRDGMLERGVVVRPLAPGAIAFCPPLVIEDRDVDLCVEATAATLHALRRSGR